MLLEFNYIRLLNFGSYHDATINLKDKGLCLVDGKNNCQADNATSNGSGKSMIGSAICFALTGETIAGVKSNLKNINIQDDIGFVELSLTVDSNKYIITRYISPKNDLKISKNNIDISGKTITESKKILETELPDVTKNLIASTIVLGQGLPNKLSSFSPAGRKDLLEKLTKSDFMIEDVKTRIEARSKTLEQQSRIYENSLLINNTNLSASTAKLSKLTLERDSAKKPDFESIIAEVTTNIEQHKSRILSLQKVVSDYRIEEESLNQALLAITNDKNTELTNLNTAFSEAVQQILLDKNTYSMTIQTLKTEVARLKSITDVCPTCHQKLPNVKLQDTGKQEAEIAQLTIKIEELDKSLREKQNKKQIFLSELSTKYDAKLSAANTRLLELKAKIREADAAIATYNIELDAANKTLLEANYNRTNWDKYYKSLENEITELTEAAATLEAENRLLAAANFDVSEHLAVVKKISTLVTRDFRGYLLEDIIKYLDAKAKEYSQIVFGTTALDIYLNKNDLIISYNDKQFDSLSGGEKQRCDIILQFAIRSLLQTYLGYSSNIIILDELFDNLDALATNKVLDLITETLKDVESVFIISHHAAELGISYDTELHVVKSAAGISEITAN